MQKIILTSLISFYFLSCTNDRGDTQNHLLPLDSVPPKMDSLNRVVKVDKDSSLASIIKEYVKKYNDTVMLDTSFNYKEKEIKVSFVHYCLHDSSIVVPDKYINTYGIREFRTHNFQSCLKIRENGKIIVDTIINKSFFDKEIFDEERKYAALLYPNLHFEKEKLVIDYSVSIPLTDVGVGVSVNINYEGMMKVVK